jgi:uncharacterized phage protein (TIGR01671 family)
LRKINFRGKPIDKNIGEWVYGFYVAEPGADHNILADTSYAWWVVDPATVGEYIGTKDKSGKDICEGDIYLCANGERCVVKYFDKYSRFALSNNNIESKLPMRIVLWSEGEVIGNIHEHPHLLEVQHG